MMVRYHTGVLPYWYLLSGWDSNPRSYSIFHSPALYFKSLVHSTTLPPNKAERAGLEPTELLSAPKGLAIPCSTNYAYLSITTE